MPELILFAHDYSQDTPALPATQLAGLPRLFDAVAWCPDGWTWGSEELTNPKFRIFSWVGASENVCNSLLGAEMPELDSDHLAVTLMQYRQAYLNLLDPRIAVALPDSLTWWQDAARTKPIYAVPNTLALTIGDIIAVRPALADPSYQGSGTITPTVLPS